MPGVNPPRVPEGLRDLMKSLTKEVLREKPPNIYQFSAEYFELMLHEKETFQVKGYEPIATYETIFKSRERSQVPLSLVYTIIPEGLTGLIKEFIKAVLRENPENICEFAVEYFRKRQKDTAIENCEVEYTAYENYFKSKERFSFTPYVKCSCGRTFGEGMDHGHYERKTEVAFATRNFSNEVKEPTGPVLKNENGFESTQVAGDSTTKQDETTNYGIERYITAIHIIQRFFRSCLMNRRNGLKKNASVTSSETKRSRRDVAMSQETAAVVIQRSYRKFNETMQKYPTSKAALVPKLDIMNHNEETSDNISEAASYTSASTVLMSAESAGDNLEIGNSNYDEGILQETIMEDEEMENENVSDSKEFSQRNQMYETVIKATQKIDNNSEFPPSFGEKSINSKKGASSMNMGSSEKPTDNFSNEEASIVGAEINAPNSNTADHVTYSQNFTNNENIKNSEKFEVAIVGNMAKIDSEKETQNDLAISNMEMVANLSETELNLEHQNDPTDSEQNNNNIGSNHRDLFTSATVGKRDAVESSNDAMKTKDDSNDEAFSTPHTAGLAKMKSEIESDYQNKVDDNSNDISLEVKQSNHESISTTETVGDVAEIVLENEANDLKAPDGKSINISLEVAQPNDEALSETVGSLDEINSKAELPNDTKKLDDNSNDVGPEVTQPNDLALSTSKNFGSSIDSEVGPSIGTSKLDDNSYDISPKALQPNDQDLSASKDFGSLAGINSKAEQSNDPNKTYDNSNELNSDMVHPIDPVLSSSKTVGSLTEINSETEPSNDPTKPNDNSNDISPEIKYQNDQSVSTSKAVHSLAEVDSEAEPTNDPTKPDDDSNKISSETESEEEPLSDPTKPDDNSNEISPQVGQPKALSALKNVGSLAETKYEAEPLNGPSKPHDDSNQISSQEGQPNDEGHSASKNVGSLADPESEAEPLNYRTTPDDNSNEISPQVAQPNDQTLSALKNVGSLAETKSEAEPLSDPTKPDDNSNEISPQVAQPSDQALSASKTVGILADTKSEAEPLNDPSKLGDDSNQISSEVGQPNDEGLSAPKNVGSLAETNTEAEPLNDPSKPNDNSNEINRQMAQPIGQALPASKNVGISADNKSEAEPLNDPSKLDDDSYQISSEVGQRNDEGISALKNVGNLAETKSEAEPLNDPSKPNDNSNEISRQMAQPIDQALPASKNVGISADTKSEAEPLNDPSKLGDDSNQISSEVGQPNDEGLSAPKKVGSLAVTKSEEEPLSDPTKPDDNSKDNSPQVAQPIEHALSASKNVGSLADTESEAEPLYSPLKLDDNSNQISSEVGQPNDEGLSALKNVGSITDSESEAEPLNYATTPDDNSNEISPQVAQPNDQALSALKNVGSLSETKSEAEPLSNPTKPDDNSNEISPQVTQRIDQALSALKNVDISAETESEAEPLNYPTTPDDNTNEISLEMPQPKDQALSTSNTVNSPAKVDSEEVPMNQHDNSNDISPEVAQPNDQALSISKTANSLTEVASEAEPLNDPTKPDGKPSEISVEMVQPNDQAISTPNSIGSLAEGNSEVGPVPTKPVDNSDAISPEGTQPNKQALLTSKDGNANDISPEVTQPYKQDRLTLKTVGNVAGLDPDAEPSNDPKKTDDNSNDISSEETQPNDQALSASKNFGGLARTNSEAELSKNRNKTDDNSNDLNPDMVHPIDQVHSALKTVGSLAEIESEAEPSNDLPKPDDNSNDVGPDITQPNDQALSTLKTVGSLAEVDSQTEQTNDSTKSADNSNDISPEIAQPTDPAISTSGAVGNLAEADSEAEPRNDPTKSNDNSNGISAVVEHQNDQVLSALKTCVDKTVIEVESPNDNTNPDEKSTTANIDESILKNVSLDESKVSDPTLPTSGIDKIDAESQKIYSDVEPLNYQTISLVDPTFINSEINRTLDEISSEPIKEPKIVKLDIHQDSLSSNEENFTSSKPFENKGSNTNENLDAIESSIIITDKTNNDISFGNIKLPDDTTKNTSEFIPHITKEKEQQEISPAVMNAASDHADTSITENIDTTTSDIGNLSSDYFIGTQNSNKSSHEIDSSEKSERSNLQNINTKPNYSKENSRSPNPSTGSHFITQIAEIHLKSFKSENDANVLPWYKTTPAEVHDDSDTSKTLPSKELEVGSNDTSSIQEKYKVFYQESDTEYSDSLNDNNFERDSLEIGSSKDTDMDEDSLEIQTPKDNEPASSTAKSHDENERTATYLYGVHTPRQTPVLSRKVPKNSTAFTISFDDNKKTNFNKTLQQSSNDEAGENGMIVTEIPKSIDVDLIINESNSNAQNDAIASTANKEKLSIDLELNENVDQEAQLDLETPTELFAELNALDFTNNDSPLKDSIYSMDVTCTAEEAKHFSFSTKHDAEEEFRANEESVLHTIVELNESETPRPGDNSGMNKVPEESQNMTASLEEHSTPGAMEYQIDNGSGSENDSELTSSWTCSKELDENVLSDEYLNEKEDFEDHVYRIKRSTPNLENGDGTGGIYEIDTRQTNPEECNSYDVNYTESDEYLNKCPVTSESAEGNTNLHRELVSNGTEPNGTDISNSEQIRTAEHNKEVDALNESLNMVNQRICQAEKLLEESVIQDDLENAQLEFIKETITDLIYSTAQLSEFDELILQAPTPPEHDPCEVEESDNAYNDLSADTGIIAMPINKELKNINEPMESQLLNNAAMKIQKCFRGHLGRRQEAKMSTEMHDSENTDATANHLDPAATIIQKVYRGYKIRKEFKQDLLNGVRNSSNHETKRYDLKEMQSIHNEPAVDDDFSLEKDDIARKSQSLDASKEHLAATTIQKAYRNYANLKMSKSDIKMSADNSWDDSQITEIYCGNDGTQNYENSKLSASLDIKSSNDSESLNEDGNIEHNANEASAPTWDELPQDSPRIKVNWFVGNVPIVSTERLNEPNESANTGGHINAPELIDIASSDASNNLSKTCSAPLVSPNINSVATVVVDSTSSSLNTSSSFDNDSLHASFKQLNHSAEIVSAVESENNIEIKGIDGLRNDSPVLGETNRMEKESCNASASTTRKNEEENNGIADLLRHTKFGNSNENVTRKCEDNSSEPKADDNYKQIVGLVAEFLNTERRYFESDLAVNQRMLAIDASSISVSTNDNASEVEANKGITDVIRMAYCETDIPYEQLEKPCIKKSVSLTKLEAGEEVLTSSTSDGPTNKSLEISSSDMDTDLETSLENTLEAVSDKLREPDVVIERMQLRHAIESKTSSVDEKNTKEPSFDEPVIRSMQDLQENNAPNIEDDEIVVLSRLQREDTRESSAQSDSIVFGDADEIDDVNHDDFESAIAKPSLKRLYTIAGDDPKSLFRSVTIDETIKYIEPPECEATSGSSFCYDEDTSENIRKKMMAYSLSEADSDFFETDGDMLGVSMDKTKVDHDDFNVSTALVDTNGTSTDTESTIVSAVAKIQAGARGFLTRRRLRRESAGTKSSIPDESKASFGNAAISESLEKLIEDEAAKKIQNAYRKHYRQKWMHPTDFEANKFELEGDDSNTTSSLENSLAARRLTLQRGDALRNDSTPDEENGANSNGKQVEKITDHLKSGPTNKLINYKIQDIEENEFKTATVDRSAQIIDNKLRWLAMRQNSMPVQIDSEVFRVIPKHMRKRIQSADGEKKRRRRILKD